jgi:hypothetical protein
VSLLKALSGFQKSDDNIYNDIIVFHVNDIIATLNKVQYDISKLHITKNIFSVVYAKADPEYKILSDKVLSYVERDIMTLIVLKQAAEYFKIPIVKKNKVFTQAIDNTYIDTIYKYNDTNIKLIKGVHVINNKLYKSIKDDISLYNLVIIPFDEISYKYFTELKTEKFTLYSSNPDVSIFLKKYRRKNG